MERLLDRFPDSVRDGPIWDSLCRRFLLPVSSRIPNFSSTAASRFITNFAVKRANPRDGIISYLTQKHGGTVHEKGVITITSLSLHQRSEWALKHLTDLNARSGLCSDNEPGQWVCLDFGDMRVHVTHYTLLPFPFSHRLFGPYCGRVQADRIIGNETFQPTTWSIGRPRGPL
jgi:hypothetical protein